MSRANWKGFFTTSAFFKKKKKKILIWSKQAVILGSLKNKTVFLYNGKEFKKFFISATKIGLKFGEFVFTRTFTQKYNLKKKKK